MKVSLSIKEFIVHFCIELCPFFLLLCFSDSLDTVTFKILFIISLPVSILRASAIASLFRMSKELNSDDWRVPAELSFYVRLLMLAGTPVVTYIPESIPRYLVLLVFVGVDVYIAKSVLNSAAALRERIEAKTKTPTKQ